MGSLSCSLTYCCSATVTAEWLQLVVLCRLGFTLQSTDGEVVATYGNMAYGFVDHFSLVNLARSLLGCAVSSKQKTLVLHGTNVPTGWKRYDVLMLVKVWSMSASSAGEGGRGEPHRATLTLVQLKDR
jgi:hypothetical protein